jgi:L-alanine-DL-glutamate epimerase-like enolase superfamily enzyme
VIDNVIAPFLVGHILADTDALRVMFLKGPGDDEYAAKMYCAVEIALLDALGKARGVPVSELIGGRVRDRIRLYGSAGMYMPPEKYAEEAAAIADLGFRAYKMRPALGPEEDLRTVKLMREATGASFDLMIDAHTWWRMGDKAYTRDGGAYRRAAIRIRNRVARRASSARRSRGVPAAEGTRLRPDRKRRA